MVPKELTVLLGRQAHIRCHQITIGQRSTTGHQPHFHRHCWWRGGGTRWQPPPHPVWEELLEDKERKGRVSRLEITEVIQSLGLETCLCHSLAVRLWETDLTFFGLSFSFVKW